MNNELKMLYKKAFTTIEERLSFIEEALREDEKPEQGGYNTSAKLHLYNDEGGFSSSSKIEALKEVQEKINNVLNKINNNSFYKD